MRFVMRFEALQQPFQPRETALQRPQALKRQTLAVPIAEAVQLASLCPLGQLSS